MEEELNGIAGEQEMNVNRLVELVKENEVILAKMRVRGGARRDAHSHDACFLSGVHLSLAPARRDHRTVCAGVSCR